MSHRFDWLYDWIHAALPAYASDCVFRAQQKAIIPTQPFVTYQVMSLDVSGFEFKVNDSDLREDDPSDPPVTPVPVGTFDRTQQTNCPMRVQLDCYSPTGEIDLASVVAFAHSDDAIAIFDAAHVSFRGANLISSLAYLSDNQYRDRFVVTVDFSIALTRTETKMAILDWTLRGEVDPDMPSEMSVVINA
jgi:hypothetical protein